MSARLPIMASHVRLLLRLPPAIRQQFVIQFPWTSSCFKHQTLRNFQASRPFSLTAHLTKQDGKGKAMYRNAQPQKPTPAANNLPKPALSPATPLSDKPAALPPKPMLKHVPAYSYSDWMSTRFPKADQVLLYVAPRHGPYFFMGWTCGLGLLTGAFFMALQYFTDSGARGVPWYIQTVGAIPTFFFTVIGTTCLMGTRRMVKSITAVRSATKTITTPVTQVPPSWILKIEVKRGYPVGTTTVLHADPSKVYVNKNVRSFAEDISFYDIAMKDSTTFTEKYFSGAMDQDAGSTLSRFNRGLVDAWPILKREVTRLFFRDQMVYIGVQGVGNFKLDLQGCWILDSGKVLEKLVQEDIDTGPNIGNWVRRWFGTG